MTRILAIPDSQIKPDSPTDFMGWIGRYIVDKKPDVVCHMGDLADMPSLSSYDYGKKAMEGRRYIQDIAAANAGMTRLMEPINEYNAQRKMWKEKLYRPQLHLTLGNHENRINRAVESDAKLEGVIGIHNLNYEAHGWTVHPYLQPVIIEGISFCHFFCAPLTGKPYGGQSILTLMKNIGHSFVAGHMQVYMIGCRNISNGQRIRGAVCGACYIEDEEYRGPQSQSEWRGVLMLNECHDGDFGLCEVSLDYLCRKYEGVRLWRFVKDKYPDVFARSLWLRRQSEVDNGL